ncbi:MAG: RidA family protein, partial [Acidimicrobiia bacterium]
PAVINGCSELLAEVFGDAGRHARSAVGVGSLPLDFAVEIELVAEVAQTAFAASR